MQGQLLAGYPPWPAHRIVSPRPRAPAAWFTSSVEEHLGRGTLPALRGQLQARLRDLTAYETAGARVLELKVKALVLGQDGGGVRGDGPPWV